MPTTRPRFQVTETPAVERALKVAAVQWPGASRSELVTRLFEKGADALESDKSVQLERRRRLIRDSAGHFDEAYHAGYLEELRGDWPD
jgi:hypothetical protein